MELHKACRKAVVECAKVEKGENALVVATSIVDRSIVDAFADEACVAGADTSILIYEARPEVNVDLPKIAFAAMKASDIVFDLITPIAGGTAYEEVVAKPDTRVLAAWGATREMLARFARLDFGEWVEKWRRANESFGRARNCTVTSVQGTNIFMEFDAKRPVFLDDAVLERPGESKTLPGGLIACLAPIEETIAGTVVIDGSLSPVGLLRAPVTMKVTEGKIKDISGGSDAAIFRKWIESFGDPNMYNIAHIGLGLNPTARMSGIATEDERVFGAFTFGIGSKLETINQFKGKSGVAKAHADGLMLESTIVLDGKTYMRQGKLVTT
jgi:leucyl aminopeptidase (aminopeptidase T)